MRRLVVLGLGMMVSMSVSPVYASTWELDPVHSSVQFAVSHLMVSTVRGTFNKFSGTVTMDDANPAKSSVDITIDAASIEDKRARERDRLSKDRLAPRTGREVNRLIEGSLTTGWKQALGALVINYPDRLDPYLT